MTHVACTLLLTLSACASQPYTTPAIDETTDGPLRVVVDSVQYHLIPDERYPGVHRLRLLVELTNHTRDTVILAFPCGGQGPRPDRVFVFANNHTRALLGMTACLLGSGTVAAMRGFAIPPAATRIDTVSASISGDRNGVSEVRLEQYLGTYRLGYSRFVKRGWIRRRWDIAPLKETMSQSFRVLRPD